jgi:hypothetical protein
LTALGIVALCAIPSEVGDVGGMEGAAEKIVWIARLGLLPYGLLHLAVGAFAYRRAARATLRGSHMYRLAFCSTERLALA